MPKNKYLLFSAFLVIFLFFGASFALALTLEVTYPNMPMLPNLNTSNPGIAEYVGYFFGLLVYVAGALALISFTVGAVQLIISAENPQNAGDAKDRMKGAVLGLVLTLASFVIIRTINPALITPTLNPLPGVAGVFLYNGTDQRPAPKTEPDTSKDLQEGFNMIQYCCNSDCSPSIGNALLVWTFPDPLLEGGVFDFSEPYVQRVTCGGTASISDAGSFTIDFETPGVYYCFGGCNGDMCSGYMSNAVTTSQNNIGLPFAKNIGGVRIVNDTTGILVDDEASDRYYGVIFHDLANLQDGGRCTAPIINPGDASICVDVVNYSNTSSADIFVLNNNPGASGDGITFYSEPWGTATSSRAGFFNIEDNEIGFPDPTILSANGMFFNYDNVNVPDGYEAYCDTLRDCPGSIKMKGSYLVGLYSNIGTESNPTLYCQTFTQDVDNLNTEPIVAAGENYVDSVYILPTK